MATYTVRSPDGTTYTVQGPAGASPAAVLQQVQLVLARRPDTAPGPMVPTPSLSTGTLAALQGTPRLANDVPLETPSTPQAAPPTSSTIVGRDWQSAQARLQQGRTRAPQAGGRDELAPQPETLTADSHPPWWWGTTPAERASGQAEALPLGDPADPVSQLAFLLAPHLTKLLGGRVTPTVVGQGAPPGTGFPPPQPGNAMPMETIDALKQQLIPGYEPGIGVAPHTQEEYIQLLDDIIKQYEPSMPPSVLAEGRAVRNQLVAGQQPGGVPLLPAPRPRPSALPAAPGEPPLTGGARVQVDTGQGPPWTGTVQAQRFDFVDVLPDGKYRTQRYSTSYVTPLPAEPPPIVPDPAPLAGAGTTALRPPASPGAGEPPPVVSIVSPSSLPAEAPTSLSATPSPPPGDSSLFAQSRVRTPEGELQIVHHGTNARDFTDWQVGKVAGDISFAENPAFAQQYATTASGHLKQVYLDIQHPFDLDTQWRELPSGLSPMEQTRWIQEQGYDGVVRTELTGGVTSKTWQVFDPAQIHSLPSAPSLIHEPVTSLPISPPAAPAAGLASMDPRALTTDPERFQYKLTHTKTGSTGSLADAAHYDPTLAGVVQVWRDPADGATYVVNGHNRVELAQRAQAPRINVQYLDAPDAQTARGIGALTNIAQGNGTPLDAATFFRETGLSVDDLRGKGIAMKGNLAQDGLALAQLNPTLFGAVARGDISVPRGILIGSKVPEPTQQYGLIKLLDHARASGKRVTDDTVAELADMVTAAPTHTATEQTLFGQETTTTSLALEKAELLSQLRNRLVDEKNLFGKVGRQGAAETLAQAGNVIDVTQSQTRSQQAAQVLALFDRLKNVTGPISDAVNSAVAQIAGGARASIVRERLYRQLLADLPTLLRGAEGAGAVTGPGVSGPGTGPTLPGF